MTPSLFPSEPQHAPRLSTCVQAAVEKHSKRGTEARGAVFTRAEVVNFILDLVGYTTEKPLNNFRILEPSFGEGAFLLPVIDRLLSSLKGIKHKSLVSDLTRSLFCVELNVDSFNRTRKKVSESLEKHGFQPNEIETLCDAWLKNGDFLLEPIEDGFSFIVGNPPYVRQELIPDVLLQEYKRRYSTIYDRADIYIPFIERSLSLLEEKGALGFICPDRWMKNRYGGPLRQMIARNYRLKFYVDMVNSAVFENDVLAYPAITVITREPAGVTRLAHRPMVESNSLAGLSSQMHAAQLGDQQEVKELKGIVENDEPWILESSDQIAIVRRLEKSFPTLEDAGCRVGIGVATGADDVFIGLMKELNVEDDRKLPLAMTQDIQSGSVNWRGYGVINPFGEDGKLVDLDHYPRLKSYFLSREAILRGRHVSKTRPASWFRTIDKITPVLANVPKLLIPDIKGSANIVYESGHLYPHHNLYFITSKEWDLRALRTLLMSGIARLFVATYTTKMHGGFLRFQAQYLRRIRVPHWKDVTKDVKKQLIDASGKCDVSACRAAAFEAYRLTKAERQALGGNGT